MQRDCNPASHERMHAIRKAPMTTHLAAAQVQGGTGESLVTDAGAVNGVPRGAAGPEHGRSHAGDNAGAGQTAARALQRGECAAIHADKRPGRAPAGLACAAWRVVLRFGLIARPATHASNLKQTFPKHWNTDGHHDHQPTARALAGANIIAAPKPSKLARMLVCSPVLKPLETKSREACRRSKMGTPWRQACRSRTGPSTSRVSV